MFARPFILAAIILLVVSGANAQEQSPNEEALGQRLNIEINANLKSMAMIIGLQRQLAAVQARVKALEDKYEPKADAPKP